MKFFKNHNTTAAGNNNGNGNNGLIEIITYPIQIILIDAVLGNNYNKPVDVNAESGSVNVPFWKK